MQDYSLLKIYSDKVVRYTPISHKKTSEQAKTKQLANLEKEKLTGILSVNTTAYIKQRLDTWLNCLIMNYDNRIVDDKKCLRLPVFVTLTLSSLQKHSDNDIKKNMLARFIEKLKYHYDVRQLFWRAETQKNGNIHFHIITDCYVPKLHIQALWNDIQETHGYIQPFYEKYSHRKPNSTDVIGVKDVKDFVRYVVKYSTKFEENRPVNGRLWGMTDSLRNFTALTTDLDSDLWKDIESLENSNLMKSIHTDYFSVFYSRTKFTDKRITPHLYEVLKVHYYNLYRVYYQNLQPIKNEISRNNEVIEDTNESLLKAFDIIDRLDHTQQLQLFDTSIYDISPFSNINYFH